MDLDSLITELQIRGFDQGRIDMALKCLVHVYVVQDFTCQETGGVLVEDVLNSYPLDITHAAAELFLDRISSSGRDAFRVRWGFESAAKWLEKQLWTNGSDRWLEFVQGLDDRYLGFFLPDTYEDARVMTFWKTRKDLKWFGVELPRVGWNILRMIDDISTIGYAMDLAFAYRKFGPEGVEGERTLLHRKAFESLKARAVIPPEQVRSGINLWKFFSEYDPNAVDIVELMKECGVGLEQVQNQIEVFYRDGLTTPYREGQYPPYLILDKKKELYQERVRMLLSPMEDWLAKKDAMAETAPAAAPEQEIHVTADQ